MHKRSRNQWVRRWGLALAALFVGVAVPHKTAVTGADEPNTKVTIRDVARSIARNHRNLLELSGGIGLHYTISVVQDPAKPVFVWPDGIDGSMHILWPEMRCKAQGMMSGYLELDGTGAMTKRTKKTLREGCYDFERNTGVSKESHYLGQITNYRNAFSAILAFPLSFCAYAEADQSYMPGQETPSDYLLPNALLQHERDYSILGFETVFDVECLKLERAGLDTIWVAPMHDWALVKREYGYGIRHPLRERVSAQNFREIAPGVWWPSRLVKQEFANEAGEKELLRLTLDVTSVSVGTLTTADVRIVLDEKMQKIEDHITGANYEMNRPVESILQKSVREAGMQLEPPRASNRAVLIGVINLAILLGAGVWFTRKYRK